MNEHLRAMPTEWQAALETDARVAILSEDLRASEDLIDNDLLTRLLDALSHFTLDEMTAMRSLNKACAMSWREWLSVHHELNFSSMRDAAIEYVERLAADLADDEWIVTTNPLVTRKDALRLFWTLVSEHRIGPNEVTVWD